MSIARSAIGALPPELPPGMAEFYRSAILDLVDRAKQRLVSDPRRLTAEARRARLLIREATAVLQQIDEGAAEWIASEVPKSYLRGVRTAEQGFAEIGLTLTGAPDPIIHQEAIQVLVNELQDDLLDVTGRLEKGFRTMTRKAQLPAELAKKSTEAIARGIAAGKSRRETSKELLRGFLDEYGEKPLRINGRNYRPDKYAEMLARTKTREAQTAGTVNRVLEAGHDLIMITAHGAKDGCGFYEGKVFSITGESEKYPPMSSLPNGGTPFHPNCKHGTAPYVEDLASGA
ncbi:MAG: hypothetical protein GY906_17755, partial [bacterium]|nr:hypothetical protein [bacterium]